MKRLLCLVAMVGLSVMGCARKSGPQFAPIQYGSASTSPSAIKNNPDKVIVTPDTRLVGKVTAVNANARFVVLNFPSARVYLDHGAAQIRPVKQENLRNKTIVGFLN